MYQAIPSETNHGLICSQIRHLANASPERVLAQAQYFFACIITPLF